MRLSALFGVALASDKELEICVSSRGGSCDDSLSGPVAAVVGDKKYVEKASLIAYPAEVFYGGPDDRLLVVAGYEYAKPQPVLRHRVALPVAYKSDHRQKGIIQSKKKRGIEENRINRINCLKHIRPPVVMKGGVNRFAKIIGSPILHLVCPLW